MTPRLRQYLELERLLLTLEEESSEAELLRDAMDPVWLSLSEADRRLLDQRAAGTYERLEAIGIAAGPELYCDVPRATARSFPAQPLTGWQDAAA